MIFINSNDKKQKDDMFKMSYNLVSLGGIISLINSDIILQAQKIMNNIANQPITFITALGVVVTTGLLTEEIISILITNKQNTKDEQAKLFDTILKEIKENKEK